MISVNNCFEILVDTSIMILQFVESSKDSAFIFILYDLFKDRDGWPTLQNAEAQHEKSRKLCELFQSSGKGNLD